MLLSLHKPSLLVALCSEEIKTPPVPEKQGREAISRGTTHIGASQTANAHLRYANEYHPYGPTLLRPSASGWIPRTASPARTWRRLSLEDKSLYLFPASLLILAHILHHQRIKSKHNKLPCRTAANVGGLVVPSYFSFCRLMIAIASISSISRAFFISPGSGPG